MLYMAFAALAGWGIRQSWLGVQDEPMLLLLFFIALGLCGGLAMVFWVLPWLAEALGTSIYSSGEKIQPTEDASESGEEDEMAVGDEEDGGQRE